MVKTGEADMATLDGVTLKASRRPGRAVAHPFDLLIEFTSSGPSPWHDSGCGGGQLRVNRHGSTGGLPRLLPAGVIVPRVMDFALQAEPMPYDLPK
jgi:hypothetical protein